MKKKETAVEIIIIRLTITDKRLEEIGIVNFDDDECVTIVVE